MINFKGFKQLYQKVEVEHYPNSVPERILISVLVQTYNHENFLKQCLDSILDQKTNFDFEILVGEDNSSDSTRNICIEYAKKYPNNIRLFLHKPDNKIFVEGIKTGNFNAFYNLFNARGKYIAFCEGDDYWTDDLKLQKQVEFLNSNTNFSLVYHNYIEQIDQTKFNKNSDLREYKDISGEDLQNLKIHPLLSTVCFLNKFRLLPKGIFDVINVDSFLISLLGNWGKGKFLNNIKPTVYRKHQGGMWTSRARKIQLLMKLHTYKKIADYYKASDLKTYRHFRSIILNHRKMIFIQELKRYFNFF